MAPTDNTMARTLHDLGLAAWFGGSLMGATGVNGAAAVVQDSTQRLRVANTGVPVEGGTTPNPTTPQEVARAQRQLTALQWVIPVLTGAVLVVNARMGEQQRPTQVSKGLVWRLLPGR
jgi:putative copper export protein